MIVAVNSLRVGQTIIGPRSWHLKIEAIRKTAKAIIIKGVNDFGEAKKVRYSWHASVETVECRA